MTGPDPSTTPLPPEPEPLVVAASVPSSAARPRFGHMTRHRWLVVGAAVAVLLAIGAWLAWPRAPGFADPSLGRPVAVVPSPAPPATQQPPEVVAALAELKSAKDRYTEQVDGWLAAMRSGAPALDSLTERVVALADDGQALHTAIDRVRVVADDVSVKMAAAFADQATMKARLDDAEARLRSLGDALRERQAAEQALIERVAKLEGRLNPLPARRAATKGAAAVRSKLVARRDRPASVHIVAVEYRDQTPYAVVETATDTAVPVRLNSVIDGWRVVAGTGGSLRLVRVQ